MKNLCLFILLLFYVSGLAQVSLPINFEGSITGNDFTPFGTGVLVNAASNTDPDVVNSSTNVAQFSKPSGQQFAGCFIDLASPLDFSNGPQLCIKVYTTSPVGTQILLKIEGGGVPIERFLPTTASGAWHERCFDFPETAIGFDRIVLFFGTNNGFPAGTFLFDDIEQPPALDGNELALDINFEGNDFNNTLIDDSNLGPIGQGHMGANGFNGGAATVIPNPNITTEGNPSATVAQIIRHSGTEAGASIDLPEDLVLDIDPILCMNVFTEADIGTEITLRIEDSNDASIFMESVAVTTVSGAWDTLCFVYHSAPVDCPTCDRLSFLFDYGPGGLVIGNGDPEEDTFLFDDIYQPLSNLSLGIFFTPGSQFFCPPSSFELSYPGTGPYEWFDNPEGTGTPIGTDPTFQTGTLDETTSFWVRDMASISIPITDVGPTNVGGAIPIDGPVSVDFTSNIANGVWHGVDVVRKWVGAVGAECTYTVTGRNLSLPPGPGSFSTTTITLPTTPLLDNTTQEYLFSPTVPMGIGENMRLEISVSGQGCKIQSFAGSGGFTVYPTETSGGEIVFTDYNTVSNPEVNNLRWNGFNYQVSGDVLTNPLLNQVNAIADCANPLPIELLDFTVKEDKGDALLQWSTASELNNDRFLLLRTLDGIRFETVGTVSGAGNSSKELHYSFRDRNPLKGLSYYMLKQVDFDGKESDSELVAFTNDGTSRFQLFPNPTSENLTLTLSEGFDKIEVRIYDLTGRLVNQYAFGATDNLSFELTGNPGTYFVEVLVDEHRKETFNVMKL